MKSVAAWLFCIACGIFAVYVAYRYLLAVILPFVFSVFIAVCLHRPTVWLSERMRISKKIMAVGLLIAALSAAALFLTAGVRVISAECERLVREISERASATYGIGERVSVVMADLLGKMPEFLFGLIPRLSSGFVFIAVTFTSSFYFCVYYDELKNTVLRFIPLRTRRTLKRVKKILSLTVLRYVKASLLVFLIIFLILLAGFTCLGVPSPIVMSLAVSLVDILPILGVGTVLIPWGLARLILYHDIFMGVGLLILYVAATVARQLIEPKIVGKRLGLHPIIALLAGYIGLKLMGLIGVILFPLLAAVVASFFSRRK